MKTRWHNSFKVYIIQQWEKQKKQQQQQQNLNNLACQEQKDTAGGATGHSCMLLGAFVVNFHTHDLRLCHGERVRSLLVPAASLLMHNLYAQIIHVKRVRVKVTCGCRLSLGHGYPDHSYPCDLLGGIHMSAYVYMQHRALRQFRQLVCGIFSKA